MLSTRPGPALCVVCATVLPPAGAGARAADPYPACSTVACRMVVGRRGNMDAAGFRHYLQLQARLTMERATNMQVAHARTNAEARENAAAWAALDAKMAARSSSNGVAASALPRLLVPSGPPRARRLAQRRRTRYRAHLLALLNEVAAANAAAVTLLPPASLSAALSLPEASAAPQLAAAASAMPGHLCGLCRGGCCTHGGDSAYLSAATLQRVMARQPALTAADVLAAYLDRLPASSQSGSCINHTSTGCALPTSLRSDICNNYACEALARLQHLQSTTAAPHVVLVVRRKQDNWRRLNAEGNNDITARAVLSEAGSRRFAPSALRGDVPQPDIA